MTRQQRLLDFLALHPGASFPSINLHLECGRSTASFAVGDALKAGLIRREGTRRHYRYFKAQRLLAASSVFNMVFA